MERRVSIGCGVGETLVKELRRMADELEKERQTTMYVNGNGTETPGLVLSLTDEGDSDWLEPVVDYD